MNSIPTPALGQIMVLAGIGSMLWFAYRYQL